jgi:hypothetical protein
MTQQVLRNPADNIDKTDIREKDKREEWRDGGAGASCERYPAAVVRST